MTEVEWLSSDEPQPERMREFHHAPNRSRKMRLVSVAAFRLIVRPFLDPRQWETVEVLESFADDTASVEEFRKASRLARNSWPAPPTADPPVRPDLHYIGLMLYREFCSSWFAHHAILACSEVGEPVETSRRLADLLRDIFGNPFRPVAFDPAWRTETAVGIARGIYEDRAFERMPILADALQEAGCEHADILNHCREPGVHVRGCWVVDLVLGKE